jgi:hypothetical protein
MAKKVKISGSFSGKVAVMKIRFYQIFGPQDAPNVKIG